MINTTNYKAFTKFPGSRKTSKGYTLKGMSKIKAPNLTIPKFNIKTTLVNVNIREKDAGLANILDSQGLLKQIQERTLHVNDSEKTVRPIYIGGHLNACIDNQLGALPILTHNNGFKVEAFFPLDHIYMSYDFHEGLERKAFCDKINYFLSGQSYLFSSLERSKEQEYVVLFNNVIIEARYFDRKDLVNPLIVRIYSSADQMIKYLKGSKT